MLKTLSQVDEIIRRLSCLKAEVNDLDAVVSSIVISLAEEKSERESLPHPYSSCGDAICNFWEDNYD